VARGTIEDVLHAKRILCFGASGSGKSTLAGRLAAALELPLALVDDLCWEAGWQQSPVAIQDERIGRVLRQATFIIDSVYARHNALALQSVDVVVALDYARCISLARLVRRTAKRVRTRELVCNGNIETLATTFNRDSILWWHFRSWRSKRERARRWHADPALPPVLLLRTPREADELLASLHQSRPA
jgi:adenylate kinase family enzyme